MLIGGCKAVGANRPRVGFFHIAGTILRSRTRLRT
jgi:hypothetical protein